MRYDLDLVDQLCREIGLVACRASERSVEIDLGHDAVLCFENAEREDDCLIGFFGTPWHTHDNPMFADGRGYYITVDYLKVLTDLKDGRILVCERVIEECVVDRWLVHSEYNDELKYVQPGEQIVLRRAPRT